MSLASIDVAVLCGGLGTRLGLPDRPKCLAEINGRPYLHWLFRKLSMHGARHVVLCAGHKGEQVIDFVAEEKKRWMLEIDVIVEPEQKGTAAALWGVRDHLKAPSTLAINGDTMTDFDLCDFGFQAVVDGRAMATLLSRVWGSINANYAGHYLISRGCFELLQGFDGLQDVFVRWRPNVTQVVGGSYIDIGTPETLAAAGPFFDRVFNR